MCLSGLLVREALSLPSATLCLHSVHVRTVMESPQGEMIEPSATGVPDKSGSDLAGRVSAG